MSNKIGRVLELLEQFTQDETAELLRKILEILPEDDILDIVNMWKEEHGFEV